ncbi:type I DNA topoisomerase [Canibacter oris]|uniref:DNA topoisomerase 1 n=1 Tax=Canibacter oris TaxID=1365628 RepID=A0A840DFB7_9MICO|nr:DNA topoisomerase-1 [Canibacter oris]
MSTTQKLVIVESPTKARTISGFLGSEYEVVASVGHIRDLAEPAALPAALKQGAFGKFAVDVENDFAPYYVVADNKKKTVAELKKALKNADELWLATDEDREGEAIAWHLLEVLQPKVPVRRMVFHEITKDAITEAIANTRDIDTDLVDAQETRRVLDRLYGYDVSPVLWRKVGPKLSAGRVQSAATRLVVDRERERIAFVSAAYCSVTANFTAQEAAAFNAKLHRVAGVKVAQGADFDDTGALQQKSPVRLLDEALAAQIVDNLDTAASVKARDTKPYTRKPAAPFTTSTLQQEASRKLRLSSRETMSLAQSLYEKGFITYMRTDSTSLSAQATSAARAAATELYGSASVPAAARLYATKAKGAQEAHEAIRPAGVKFTHPSALHGKVSPRELSLYDLIWKRTVASQMANAAGSTDTLTIAAKTVIYGAETPLEFTVSGTVITFQGFLAAYEEGRDEKRGEQAADTRETRLPQLEPGAALQASDAAAKAHTTTPPARYTEASLTKRLEELGVGRPSTYAAIMSTIMDRGYVTKQGQALVPSFIAFSVVKLLEEHFAELVDYDFTAQMEADLDRIAAGETNRAAWLHDFYFGTANHPGLRGVVDNLGEIDARAINTMQLADNIALRNGRYGPYLEVLDDKCERDETGALKPRAVSLPADIAPDELTAAKALELAAAEPAADRVLGVHPETGRNIVAKNGRFGPYVTEQLRADEKLPKGEKLLTASLFKTMSPETVDFETALQLLSLPRVVGADPQSGEEILAQNGKFGPYLKKGTETRTLPNEEAIFSIDLPGALELLAQPKYGARRQAAAPLREFDNDPVSEKPIKVKDGRFGPYITDGVTNVTVPRGEDIAELTFDRVVELLAIKRAKGPAKRGTKKAPAKKTVAKTATAKKKVARKTTTKKTVDPVRSAAAKKAAATRKANAAKKAAAEAAQQAAVAAG